MPYEKLSPEAITVLLYMSPNDVTYVQDDPDAPDGNVIVATYNGVAGQLGVTFPTPTRAPSVGVGGEGLQEIRIYVRWKNAVGGVPRVRINLFEGDYLRQTGTLQDVPVNGQIVSQTWNASILGTPDGSDLWALIFVVYSDEKDNNTDIGAVEWVVCYGASFRTLVPRLGLATGGEYVGPVIHVPGGSLWVEGTKLHWGDETDNERSFEGEYDWHGEFEYGYSPAVGPLWIEGIYLYYIDDTYGDQTYGDQHRCEGTLVGATVRDGPFWIEGADLHYVDEYGDERYVKAPQYF